MNNIDDMPAKCKSCPYWEACEYPYICQDIEPKPAENGNLNAGIAENLQNRPTDGDYLISQRAAIEYLRNRSDEARECGHEETYFDLLTIINGFRNVETAPAIPLAWIESYIQTCEIFDLRANVPAEKIDKAYDDGYKAGYLQGKFDARNEAPTGEDPEMKGGKAE